MSEIKKGESWRKGYQQGIAEESSKCHEHCEQARQAERKQIIDFIDAHYLEYCRTQNGRNECKNCGLNLPEIKSLLLE